MAIFNTAAADSPYVWDLLRHLDRPRPVPQMLHVRGRSWTTFRRCRATTSAAHTITHPDLTTLSRAKVTQEVCGNRQDLIKHGIMDPLSFAYPFGSYDPTAESVVRQCGFTTARVGNGISGSSTRPGPPYAETIPPSNPYKLRTIAVDAAQPERLPDLEAYVSATAAHGGGWLVITFHDVCDAKASDYKVCMAKYGSIEDTVFAQFLDWLQSAGQPGGAPSEVRVRDVCQVMNCP